MALSLPDFPWDSLAAAAAVARRHEGGIVDLSVGSPGGAAKVGVIHKDHPVVMAEPPRG